jgi:hypothetical protein
MRREHGLRVVNERLFKAGIVSDLHGRITFCDLPFIWWRGLGTVTGVLGREVAHSLRFPRSLRPFMSR